MLCRFQIGVEPITWVGELKSGEELLSGRCRGEPRGCRLAALDSGGSSPQTSAIFLILVQTLSPYHDQGTNRRMRGE